VSQATDLSGNLEAGMLVPSVFRVDLRFDKRSSHLCSLGIPVNQEIIATMSGPSAVVYGRDCQGVTGVQWGAFESSPVQYDVRITNVIDLVANVTVLDPVSEMGVNCGVILLSLHYVMGNPCYMGEVLDWHVENVSIRMVGLPSVFSRVMLYDCDTYVCVDALTIILCLVIVPISIAAVLATLFWMRSHHVEYDWVPLQDVEDAGQQGVQSMTVSSPSGPEDEQTRDRWPCTRNPRSTGCQL
jgi:hypothetical protein